MFFSSFLLEDRTVTSVVLSNTGPSNGFVGIACPSVARIIPIDPATFGGELLCQPDAFLYSVHDVTVTNIVEQRGVRNVVAGAEGGHVWGFHWSFWMKLVNLGFGIHLSLGILRQRLAGQGLAFVVAGGFAPFKLIAPLQMIWFLLRSSLLEKIQKVKMEFGSSN